MFKRVSLKPGTKLNNQGGKTMCRHNDMLVSCPRCEMEVAPIVNQNGRENNFKGYGNSHFSHVEGQGFHVTTDIPDIDVGIPIKHHDDI